MHHSTVNRILESLQNIRREAGKIKELMEPDSILHRKTEQPTQRELADVSMELNNIHTSAKNIRLIITGEKELV